MDGGSHNIVILSEQELQKPMPCHFNILGVVGYLCVLRKSGAYAVFGFAFMNLGVSTLLYGQNRQHIVFRPEHFFAAGHERDAHAYTS